MSFRPFDAKELSIKEEIAYLKSEIEQNKSDLAQLRSLNAVPELGGK